MVSHMWTCPKCGESLEDQFDSCWKCARQAPPEPAESSEHETQHEHDIGVIVEGVRKIRRRRNIGWILFALFLPVLFVVGQLFGEKVLIYSVFLYLLLDVAAGVWSLSARCPRCGELFYLGLSPWLAWRGRCWNCRLALGDYVP